MPATDQILQQEGGVLTDQLLGLLRTGLVSPTFASVTLAPGGGIINQPALLAASGAIPVVSGASVITKAGVAALTLAAPVAGTQDGVVLIITSNTAFAHTITATGLFQTGTATVNLATFAAFAGASIWLFAYQGKWNVLSLNAVVLT